MKLDNYEKMQLRKHIVAQLKNVPEGQRIHLDKDLLEELLFETETFANTTIKIPFWCGEFLSKIDLSELSFEDVSWNLLAPNYNNEPDIFLPYINLIFNEIEPKDVYDWTYYELKEMFEFRINGLSDNYKSYNYYVSDLRAEDDIYYKNTNANIDFTKSFESKKGLGIQVRCCNFSGMDFSNLDINMFDNLESVDLSNTGIRVSNMDKFINNSFRYVNLNGNDLNHITVDYYSIVSIYNNSYIGLNETKLNVTAEKDIEDCFEDVYPNDADFLDGCYFNGELVKINEITSKIVTENKQEDLFSAVIQNIEEQKKSFRR